MRIFRVAAVAAISSLALVTSAAQANSACWYPNEAKAAQVRGLQTMLMVGTLQCRRNHHASVGLYNDFISNQRRFLDANSQILKARFMRENGVGVGQGAYDRFATSLANQYSEQLDDPDFCRTVHHYARMAARATSHELLLMAEAVAQAPETGQCAPSNYAFEREDRDDGAIYARRDEPMAPPKVVISDTTSRPLAPSDSITPKAVMAPAAVAEATAEVAAADASAPVEAVQTAVAHGDAEPVIIKDALPKEDVQEVALDEKASGPVIVEAKAAVVQQAAVEVAAAPAKADRDQALKAAIAALQSAVVALEAASSEPAPAPADTGGN